MADFVKPWEGWTPEIAEAVRVKLVSGSFGSVEEYNSALRALEGYQAEQDARRASERNASLFSKEGIRNQVRRLSPKGMEATEQGRPWYERLAQSTRDAVTLPWRAGLELAGDIGNAVRVAKGSEPVEREVYSMDNASSVTHNDPMVVLTALPQGRAMQLVGKGGQLLSSLGVKALEKVGPKAAKVGGAVGGAAGEAGVLAGEEYVGNMGDVSAGEAAVTGLVGTGIGKGLSAAVPVVGKGAQYYAKAKTRQKYNPNKSDVEKRDLTGRSFGGKQLRETETLMLESGEMGRVPDAAEAIAGEGSAWEARVSEAYQNVAKRQNFRLKRTIRGKKFRNLCEEAGADVSEIDELVKAGREPQEAVAYVLNKADSELRKTQKSVDGYYDIMGKLLKRLGKAGGQERAQIIKQYNKLKKELKPIEEELAKKNAAMDNMSSLLRKNGTGVINRKSFRDDAAEEIQTYFKGTKDAKGNIEKDSKIDWTQSEKATEALDEINAIIDKDVQHILETNSGRFIPMRTFRNQVRITTRSASQKRAGDLFEKGNADIAKESIKTTKRRLDQEQSKGDLGDAARSESLRFGIEQGLENIQTKVDNNNRMTVRGLEALIQRLPVYDKALMGLYNFGTKLAPRSEQGNISRQGLLLPESRGGEWQANLQAILGSVGREAPHLKDRDKLTPTAKAAEQIDRFIASIEAVKQGEAR